MMVGKTASQMSFARVLRCAMAGVEDRSSAMISASIPGARFPILSSSRKARADPKVASHNNWLACRGVPRNWPIS